MVNTTKCGSCGAAIWWAQTHRGKNMPMDVEEVDPEKASWHGLFYYSGHPAYVRPAVRTDPGPFYRSHFLSCPESDEWRKPKLPHVDEQEWEDGAVPDGDAIIEIDEPRDSAL